MTDKLVKNPRPVLLTIAALGVALSLSMMLPAAQAQSNSQGNAPMQEEGADYTEAQLQAFAKATLDVQKIAIAYKDQIETSRNAAEQEALQEKQMTEMIGAVEAVGLEVEQYNSIQLAYAQDEEVRARVDGYIQTIQ